MWIEYASYILTFIISAGIAVIGIMVSYHLHQSKKQPVMSILLYQQIFLFSFFIYGIWGNIALREIIGDLSLNERITEKLSFFIPVLGIPFMVVSWFMLLKFSYNLNGYKFPKPFVYSYFPTFVVIIFTISVLIQKEIIEIPAEPDLFVVRIIIALNLLAHVFFLIPFFRTKVGSTLLKETGFNLKWAFIYFSGIIFYSVALSFFSIFGFISTCIAILFLFAVSVFIPLRIRMNLLTGEHLQDSQNLDFNSFCKLYEISKREAEIVMEICSGKSNKAISEKLFITLQTVKDHNHRIYTKTGVKSRMQLANLVREKTRN